MAPVRKTMNGDRSRNGNPQTKRVPRKLTVRRQAMVLEFMAVFRANPQNYSRYGTEEWMKSLIEHMNDNPRYGLNTEDVKHWLETERIFEHENADFDYGSLQEQSTRPQPAESSEALRASEDLPTGADADYDTIPLGFAIKMEVDQDPVEEPYTAFLQESNDDATAATGSLPVPQGTRQGVQLSGPAEAVHEAMIRYSQATSGIYPAVLPSQPSGSTLPEFIGQLRGYSAMMIGIVNDLLNARCTSINVAGCFHAVNLLNIFLTELEKRILDESQE